MRQSWKTILFACLIALILIAIKLHFLIPSFNFSYMDTYRVGIVPVNDAADWVERAQMVFENKKISIRPLFPLFLANIIFLFGVNLPAIISVLILINIASVVIAYLIIKDMKNKAFAFIFLAFIASWRIISPGNIMTEALGAPVLLIGFSLIIRGLELKTMNLLALGYFLTGLAQGIRPWDFAVIITLPLVPVFYKGFNKKAVIYAGILYAAVGLGFGIDSIASKAFSTQEQSKIDKAHHVYGQFSGSRGDNFWIMDNDLRDATVKNILGKMSNDEVADIMYKKSFENLRKNPLLIINAPLSALKVYFTNLWAVFKLHLFDYNYFFLFLILFFIFVVENKKETINPGLFPLSRGKFLFIAASILFYMANRLYLFSFWALLGLFFMFSRRDRRQTIFFLCYFSGIILSFFVVGVTGPGRMWISQELLTYYLCALGASGALFGRTLPLGEDDNSDFNFDAKKTAVLVGSAFMISLIFFVMLPAFERGIKKNATYPITSSFSSESIAKDLGITDPILSENVVTLNIVLWPLPTFEKYNGSWAYWKLTYRDMKGFYLKANEGVTDPKWQFSKWYLMKMPFNRVAYDDRNPIVFPNVDKSKLKRFEGSQIIIVGKLIGRKRLHFTHQGFIIVCEYIGYEENPGKIKWVHVRDL